MLDWIYPVTCELCGERSKLPICDACLNGLPAVPKPICLYCGTPVVGGQADAWHCPHCQARPRSFNFARSAIVNDDTVMKLVHGFKYHGSAYLARAFAELLNRLWEETPELEAHKDWVLVPVPASGEHLRQRGYNQAELLAACLAKRRRLSLITPIKHVPTGVSSQTRLASNARRRNALLSYQAARKRALPPHLLLIDDVYTTGSTIRACAKVLRHIGGAKVIGALTLLRIMRKNHSLL